MLFINSLICLISIILHLYSSKCFCASHLFQYSLETSDMYFACRARQSLNYPHVVIANFGTPMKTYIVLNFVSSKSQTADNEGQLYVFSQGTKALQHKLCHVIRRNTKHNSCLPQPRWSEIQIFVAPMIACSMFILQAIPENR